MNFYGTNSKRTYGANDIILKLLLLLKLLSAYFGIALSVVVSDTTFKGNDCLSAFEHKSESLNSMILFVLRKCLEKCVRKRLRKCLEKCLNLEQKS